MTSVDGRRPEVIGVDQLDRAVERLVNGGLVAIPTETVYGLAADAASATAVSAIFRAKGRPPGHPLIVHGHDPAIVLASADDVSDAALKLADAFWPGPLTIVLPRRLQPRADGSPMVAAEAVGGRSTVGLRVPDHPVTLDLLARFAQVGSGLTAAPSANGFGSVSPTTATHVVDDALPGVDLVVDGGPCRIGVESTIVDLTGPEPELLRPGGISMVELEAVIGPVRDGRFGDARASGMLTSHYAPQAPVDVIHASGPEDVNRLTASQDGADGRVGVIAPFPIDGQPNWVMPADARGYAAQLYGALRSADQAGVDRIVVVPPRSGDLLDAVVDRLTKASA